MVAKIKTSHGKKIREKLFKEQKGLCAYCLKPMMFTKHPNLGNNMTLDHIIPKSKGGTNIQSNLIGACESCNTKKGSKTKHIKIKLPRKIIYQLPITPKIFTFSVYTILPKDIYQAGNKIKIHVMKKDINKYYFQTII
jgi:5-methylcytosine-specific restriction endonuclease McrA